VLRGKGLLTPIQRAFVEAFARLPEQERFYLAGGTALAEFYLGHRLSFDLDFFTPEAALILPQSYQIEALGEQIGLTVSVIRRFTTYAEFLIVQGDESVKVDLAQDSPFRFESPLLSEAGIWVNDLLDLKVDKLLAFYGRAEPRDAVDLHIILQNNSLEHLLRLAAQKDPGFDLYWFAVSLNRAAEFPDQLERWPVKMIQPFAPVQLKLQFLDMALKIISGLPQDTHGAQ
jgi:hypothetical protein